MERLIIDTDTAGDDCVSLLIALRSPNVTVEVKLGRTANTCVCLEADGARFRQLLLRVLATD